MIHIKIKTKIMALPAARCRIRIHMVLSAASTLNHLFLAPGCQILVNFWGTGAGHDQRLKTSRPKKSYELS